MRATLKIIITSFSRSLLSASQSWRRRTLALIDQGKIRQQDYVRIFPALLADSPAREIAWDYLKAHWDSLAEKVTSFWRQWRRFCAGRILLHREAR